MFSFQVFAEDTLTIVAVGDADQETDKIAVLQPDITATLKPREKKVVNELIDLMTSDFSLYKHLFDVSDKLVARTTATPDYKGWKDQRYRYVISFSIFAKEKVLHTSYSLYDVQKGTELLSESGKIWVKNIRNFGHQISNKMYKAITGNDSVFNTKIVFVSDRTSKKRDTRKELYIMDFDGNKKQRLTYTNSMIISPSISQDNTKITYTNIEGKWRRSSRGKLHKIKNLNLYILNLKTKKTTLVSEKNGMNSGAIFAPDGEHIYLTLSNLKNADIFKMHLKTKKLTKITKHFTDDVDPNINYDGSLMTFLSGRSGRAMIYTLDPTGTDKSVKRISYVGRFNASPRFSPDGREIIFSSWVDNRFDLYKIGSDGKNLVRLTKNFGSNEEASFSPDGQFIVFTSQRVISSKKAVQDIYIMNREGEIIKKVTSKYGKVYTPRWSNILK